MSASGGDIRIGEAHALDLHAMEQICIDTADQGHDPTPERHLPALLPAIWLTPYMAPDADTVCLVARRDAPSHVAGADPVGRSDILGYCIASRDARAFAERLAGDWFPRVRARLEPLATDLTPADRAPWDMIRHPVVPDEPWLHDHPGEVHVDLLPQARGLGLGRRLLDAMGEHLRADGVRGFFLGVDPLNEGAQGFYEHLGMRTLRPRGGRGPVYGVSLVGPEDPAPA